MDISVLTEQRREMVIDLLKGMKIRKSDGEGFDRDDVYACMQQLCDVYEKSIDDLTVSYETEISDLQDKYQKYDENNELYISLIMEAKKSSTEIINKAKTEVDEILAAGKEQIAQQEAELEDVKASVAREKAQLAEDLEAARAAAEKDGFALAASIEEEQKKAEAAKQKYRDQIAVMDQEFVEIKTNILRTAGKIDGLKAQLEETGEEAQWQLQDEPEPMEEPAPQDAPAAPEELSFEELVAKLQRDDAAKAGVAEVEAPAETPVIEPEIEAVATPVEEEPEVELFNFEPTFSTPTPAPEVPAVEEPDIEVPLGEMDIDTLAASIQGEAPVPEFDLDPVAAGSNEEVTLESFSLDPVVEDTAADTVQGLGSMDDLALEEIPADLSAELPAQEQEGPIEEISFEGLEELFKE